MARTARTAHYDQNGICWHPDGRLHCGSAHRDDEHYSYGRCRSGRRWFWTAFSFGLQAEPFDTYGWADTEQEALDVARAAIVRAANGCKASAACWASAASHKLKELNAAKRAARPASGAADSKFVEYLFGYRSYDGERYLKRFQITKKTAKRIYYLCRGEPIDEHGELEDHFGIDQVTAGSVSSIGRSSRRTAKPIIAADIGAPPTPPSTPLYR
jgi:hypothetical protein